jgi:propionyl-CoA carboxylase beta chain
VATCSGVVPVVAVVTGPAVSGPSLVLGLADLVVVTAGSRTYVSGPHAVRNVTGLAVSADQLGGASVHATRSGLAAAVADDPQDAMAWVEDLLACLPPSNNSLADDRPSADPADRPTPELRTLLPEAPTGSYDVREVLRSVVDDADLLELRPHWAPNLITAFAAIGGIRVGLVANQPCQLAGTLDIVASQKGARFVAMCDAFGLPLVTVVDTPGFSPGKDLEWRGMIRKGAQLAFAYARATVPRVNLTLRKSYGGAYIVMDSKRIGNDVALAWPSAEIAVMGARGAVEILHRKASPEERIGLEADYEQRLLNPYVAAERGLIDAVIDPGDTRREVAAALAMLASKREHLPPRAHDNSPL